MYRAEGKGLVLLGYVGYADLGSANKDTERNISGPFLGRCTARSFRIILGILRLSEIRWTHMPLKAMIVPQPPRGSMGLTDSHMMWVGEYCAML